MPADLDLRATLTDLEQCAAQLAGGVPADEAVWLGEVVLGHVHHAQWLTACEHLDPDLVEIIVGLDAVAAAFRAAGRRVDELDDGQQAVLAAAVQVLGPMLGVILGALDGLS